MRNPLSLILAFVLIVSAYCFIPQSDSEARFASSVPSVYDASQAMIAAASLRQELPKYPMASFVSTDAASAPESSDEPISTASSGSYGYSSSSAGSYGYGSYNSSSSSGAYGSYNSGSSSGSYGTKETYAFHRAPVRGFFRNGGLFRRGIIRGRWQAHGPHGGLFSGGCSHCRS